MVFSSIPIYLDPPNWHQHSNQQQDGNENPQLPPPPPPPPSLPHAATVLGSVSMADRARLAKIQQPETPLKCPRCESTNTKFCYFNNYSLSQPRHFCKTCRRYWTRGGALRNVPVGGGCRRNKRSKGSSTRTKSPVKPAVTSSNNNNNPTSSGHPKKQQLFRDGNLLSSNASMADHVIGHLIPPPPHLPFLSPLHNLGDYGASIGRLNFQAIPAAVGGGNGGVGLGFQMGGTSNGGRESHLNKDGFGVEVSGQWKLQQFPFLANLEGPALVPFGSEGLIDHQPLSSGVETQIAPVKMEANQGLHFSKNLLGISANHDQIWSGNNNNAWSELSGFPPSSTNNLL